ncbi:MAG: LTA synthase family protein [bacterium]
MVKRPAKKITGGIKKSRKNKLSGNIYVVMFLKLLVVLLLFFISRIVFYLFNLHYFSTVSSGELFRIFLAGFRFDISAVLMLNLPFILLNSIPFRFRYKKVIQGFANAWFYLMNPIGLMTNFVDTVYFRFTLKRMTADIFKYLKVGGDFDRLVPQFIYDFWYIILVWIGFVIIMILLCRKIRLKGTPAKGKHFAYYSLNTLAFALTGFLFVIGFRGGFQLRPVSVVTAGQYTIARNVPLLLNSPFSIFKTYFHPSLEPKKYFSSESELSQVYNPVHKGKKSGFKAYNVLIIIMESFSREHIGFLNKHLEEGQYRGFTPVFDSLIQQGVYFEGFANEKTSIMAVPAILSGIPCLMNDAFIQSAYSGDNFTSIAGLLKPKGYTSAFFHGGTNGTMGFDVYARLVGFDKYYGRSEYNNEKDYDGKWGIRDEEFFQFTAQRLDELKQPFVAVLFSLSSHHPYYVPGKYKHMFRKGKLPIQQSIMYADYSLGQFLKSISKMPWYKNTVLVITADHTSEGFYPYYQTPAGQYAIPILFLFPDKAKKGIYLEIAQQTDIMPTVLNYLGFDKDFIAFGSDMLDPLGVHFSVHYPMGLYSLIKDGYYLEFDGVQSIALYDLKKDSLQKSNLIGSKPGVKERMEKFLKAYIQQYNNRVIENRLTAE